MDIIAILVGILAGVGAGIGVGFASMSSAVVIGPVLITFLHMNPYQAVGIGLACDILASAVSAHAYAKTKAVDLKNGISLGICVLAFTVIGSVISSFLPDQFMGQSSVASTIVMGAVFLIPQKKRKDKTTEVSFGKKNLVLLIGAAVGLICGMFGAGGGMMIVLALTALMRYDFRTAVGTSLLIMTATALCGAVSHFVIGGVSEPLILPVVILSTAVAARCAAAVANRLDPVFLRKLTGAFLLVLAAIVLLVQKFL